MKSVSQLLSYYAKTYHLNMQTNENILGTYIPNQTKAVEVLNYPEFFIIFGM